MSGCFLVSFKGHSHSEDKTKSVMWAGLGHPGCSLGRSVSLDNRILRTSAETVFRFWQICNWLLELM